MKGEGWDEGWGAAMGVRQAVAVPVTAVLTTGDCEMDSTPLGIGRAKRPKSSQPGFFFS